MKRFFMHLKSIAIHLTRIYNVLAFEMKRFAMNLKRFAMHPKTFCNASKKRFAMHLKRSGICMPERLR